MLSCANVVVDPFSSWSDLHSFIFVFAWSSQICHHHCQILFSPIFKLSNVSNERYRYQKQSERSLRRRSIRRFWGGFNLDSDLCSVLHSVQDSKALNSCSASTGDIISTTERLKQELEATTQRQEIVACFLCDCQLSPEEINALRDEDLNESFFKALSHVQEIHANCKVLLRTLHQEYVIVLLRNGKSKEQARNKLNVFLGDDGDSFVSW